MLSAKLVNYWYHFYNFFGMTQSLNPGPPALEASTLPLGYRGGGEYESEFVFSKIQKKNDLENIHYIKFKQRYLKFCKD